MRYFIFKDAQVLGPYSPEDLTAQSDALGPETLVCQEDMAGSHDSDWKALEDFPELAEIARSSVAVLSEPAQSLDLSDFDARILSRESSGGFSGAGIPLDSDLNFDPLPAVDLPWIGRRTSGDQWTPREKGRWSPADGERRQGWEPVSGISDLISEVERLKLRIKDLEAAWESRVQMPVEKPAPPPVPPVIAPAPPEAIHLPSREKGPVREQGVAGGALILEVGQLKTLLNELDTWRQERVPPSVEKAAPSPAPPVIAPAPMPPSPQEQIAPMAPLLEVEELKSAAAFKLGPPKTLPLASQQASLEDSPPLAQAVQVEPFSAGEPAALETIEPIFTEPPAESASAAENVESSQVEPASQEAPQEPLESEAQPAAQEQTAEALALSAAPEAVFSGVAAAPEPEAAHNPTFAPAASLPPLATAYASSPEAAPFSGPSAGPSEFGPSSSAAMEARQQTQELIAKLAKPVSSSTPPPVSTQAKPAKRSSVPLLIGGAVLLVAVLIVWVLFFGNPTDLKTMAVLGAGHKNADQESAPEPAGQPEAVQAQAGGPAAQPGVSNAQTPMPAAAQPQVEPNQAAIDLVKGYPLDGDRNTVAQWLQYSFAANPNDGNKEEWTAGALDATTYLVQYRVIPGPHSGLQEAISYLFEADINRQTVKGSNAAAQQLLAGGGNTSPGAQGSAAVSGHP